MELGYLDAGTGSMIVSAIVAGAAGVGVVLRLGWRRIVGVFSPKRRAEAGHGAAAGPVPSASTSTATPTEPGA